MNQNEYLKNKLRIHWNWLKDTDYENAYKFIIAHLTPPKKPDIKK